MKVGLSGLGCCHSYKQDSAFSFSGFMLFAHLKKKDILQKIMPD